MDGLTEGLQVRRVSLDALRPDPANPRAHDAANLAAIKASLARFGQAEPLVVQQGTQRIIAGHGRLAAMQALGWTECQVVELPVTDLEATALGIALNRSGELASWDDGVLARLLTELRTEDALDGVGFDDSDLDALLDQLQAETGDGDLDLDAIPEPPDNPITRPGDLWALGDHRLLCGDSSLPADLDRLLDGAPIHLVNSDPPYNVKVEPRSNNAIAAGNSSFSQTHHQKLDLARHPEKAKPTTKKMRAKDRPLINDFLSDEEFDRLLAAWFGNIARVLLPGRGFFIWGGYANTANYPPALKTAGLYFSQSIIWDKQHPVLTRKDFMGAHEWCFYGWKEGAAHQFFGPNNATDLWQVKKVNPQSMVHLTEKPVELASRALLYSSRRGENVLDLFGGSGSTLMACQETQRRGFLMELDPPYCDVIVTRWQNATGQDATLDGDGRTFTERSAEVEP
ncbi:MAG: chromosome partitioning protein ParB [Planctomycetota bacterium]|nr:MAG: chromosome partitioning protein ParB [Planctomycetota bacterium]